MNREVGSANLYPQQFQLELISRAEEPQFDQLMQQHHRRGALRKIGNELRYAASYQGQWLALLSFSPAALQCAARDRWIGWHRQHQTDRLKLIANNSRFLILPNHHYPNLATRVLAGCRRRIQGDWLERFSQPLLMLETFVDTDHHQGTIYLADNWTMVGTTRGYRRIYGGYSATATESVKRVFVYPLQRDARCILSAPRLAQPYQSGAGKMKLTGQDCVSLLDYFESIPDFRRPQGKRYRLSSVLALIAAAMLSGARGYKGIWVWSDELSQKNRRHFRLRLVKGKRLVPSITVIRNAITEVSPEALQEAVNTFCDQHFGLANETLAIDGKTLRGSLNEDDKQVQVINVVGHKSSRCYSKKKSASCR